MGWDGLQEEKTSQGCSLGCNVLEYKRFVLEEYFFAIK
jgi:hypothetical protein